MKVIVRDEFWELFPKAEIGLLVAKGLNNQVDEEKDPFFAEMLQAAAKKAEQFIQEEPFTQNEVIKEWREAFSTFKTKKGARSSIEALLKRVSQGRTFSPINPLVDIYNSVSLAYGVPCGGEDLAKIEGDLQLGKAKGGESFFPLGAESDAPALADEICYVDDAGAVCRCFNWREAERTMLTEETTDAILVIESINVHQAERMHQGLEELQKQVEAYFGVETEMIYLTAENPQVELV
ncbi:phenylalanine--tRNA ligase beta subunit-related protein [Streptococcus pneumoniae]